MTRAEIQYFFETPLVECQLNALGADAAMRAAILLAERYTIDVSRPVSPRFAWTAAATERVIESGSQNDWQISSGKFWVAYLCLDAADCGAGILIEDPRAMMTAAGIPGLSVAQSPPTELIRAEVGLLTMFPAYVRHRLIASQTGSSRWVEVALTSEMV